MENSIIPFYKQNDKFIVKSKGCYMYDSDNKQYIDFESGDWSANIGHSDDRISRVICKQVETSIHDGLRFRNYESEELSLRLLEKLYLPNGQSAFLNSGSEAVNLGIVIAKSVTGRSKVLKMDCSYLSAFGHGQISANNAGLVNIIMDDFSAIDSIDFSDIAAFVFEPGNASSLIKYPKNDFIKTVSEATRQHGGLLMANEVTAGFGRTGKWFGHQYYEFVPDIVSVGKGLGNGYPVSGVSISSGIADLFDKSSFRYAQSHQNDPLGCAVGIEVMNIMDSDKLIERSFETGEYFYNQLLTVQMRHAHRVKEIRARGLMIGMELSTNSEAESMYGQLIERGFLVGCKLNVIRFMPPLTIEKEAIDNLITAMDEVLTSNII